ncbi:hypothetical protein [Flavobacterium sp. AG291]|nr:hypothetical protein [Flavobacterium sp. AG291]
MEWRHEALADWRSKSQNTLCHSDEGRIYINTNKYHLNADDADLGG